MNLRAKHTGSILAVCCLCLTPFKSDAASLAWTGANNGTWSTPTNWSPNGTPGAADSAAINNASANQTVIFDAAASGTINGLTITQTTTGVTNTLQIIRAGSSTSVPSLLVKSNITLGGGTPNAVSAIWLDPSLNQSTGAGSNLFLDIGSTTGSGTLTLNPGGSLALGSYAYYNGSSSTAYTSTVKGAIVISGGLLSIPSIINPSNRTLSAFDTNVDAVSMSSGTISLGNGSTGSVVVNPRLRINGNLTTTGGVIALGTNSTLSLYGNTNSIGNGTTMTNAVGSSIAMFGGDNQSLIAGCYINSLGLRNGTLATSTRVVGSTYTTATPQFGAIKFGESVAGGTTTMKLGSDLSTASLIAGWGATASDTIYFNTDLNGKKLSVGGASWAPGNITSNVVWDVQNSSSDAGSMIASSFDFSSAYQVNIGRNSTGGVVLTATGNGANNLATSGTITPNSTFAFSGSVGTLYSGRTIGRLSVGNGASTSALSLATTNLSVGGDVTVNTSGTLNLAGLNLTQVAVAGGTNGGLNGSGTVVNNTAGTATLTLDTTNGDGNFSGTIKDGTGIVSVTKNGTGTQVLGGSNTYTGATTVSAGKLEVNGSLAAASSVTVGSGAILSGSGKVGGATTVNGGTVNGNGLTLGSMTLTGSSTLSGYNIASSVTVSSGSTSLTGTTKATSTLTVSSGATLNHNGTVDGNMSVNGWLKGTGAVTGNLSLTSGTLAPGNTSEIKTISGNLTMDGASTLVMTFEGTAHDQIQVGGSLILAGTLDLSTLNGFSQGDTITLIENVGSGSTTGHFTKIITSDSTYTISETGSTYTFDVGGTEYLLNYAAKLGTDSAFNDVTLTVVPEPSTWAMIMGGLGMLVFGQRMARRMADQSE